MPYLHGLGTECSCFPDWTETDEHEKSLTQYVGQVTGARQPGTVADCQPSATCSTTADNLFRQLRTGHRDTVNYRGGRAPHRAVRTATRPSTFPRCTSGAPTIERTARSRFDPCPSWTPTDCPRFAFVTPTLCNDGHDCAEPGRRRLGPTSTCNPSSTAPPTERGKVAVFVWYDEDRRRSRTSGSRPPPSPAPGADAVGTSAATLRPWQSMLGVPCLADACSAADLHAATRLPDRRSPGL